MDRAAYLAKTLMMRMKALEKAHADGDAFRDLENPLPRELVEKVMAVEEGVADGAVISAILDAIPICYATPLRDRDVQALADFLRERILK